MNTQVKDKAWAKVQLPVTVLTLELLCNVIRLFYTALGPCLSSEYFTYIESVSTIMVTLPIANISSFAVSMVIKKIVNDTLYKGRRLYAPTRP